MIEITHKGTPYRADRVVLPGDPEGYGEGRSTARDLQVHGTERLVAGYTRTVKTLDFKWNDTVRPKWHRVRQPSVGVLIAFANAERERRELNRQD